MSDTFYQMLFLLSLLRKLFLLFFINMKYYMDLILNVKPTLSSLESTQIVLYHSFNVSQSFSSVQSLSLV